MTIVFGTDEAGKGSLIGNLCMAGVIVEESKVGDLEAIGAKDSKLLTHKKRIEVAKEIKKIVKDYIVVEALPSEIDEAIDGNNSLNLNWFEANHIAEMINKLKPDTAIIDCPSPNIEKFTDYIKNRLDNKEIKLIVEHKADANHFPVAAASILAKVARENNVKKIEEEVGESIGSGYPSNPVCKEFLKNNYLSSN